jgi:hypothetical protein
LCDFDQSTGSHERKSAPAAHRALGERRSALASQEIGYTMLADPKGAINLELGIRDEQYPVRSAL